MTKEDLYALAREYADDTQTDMSGYIRGFRQAIELVNQLNDGSRGTFYVYDTPNYSSQRRVVDVMNEL
jgi:hypothetical protein